MLALLLQGSGKSMIIAKLKGGLGNQMFQYAVGRHLAKIHQKPLLLDPNTLSSPDDNLTPRIYELDVFENITAEVVSRNQLKALRRRVPFTVWYVEGRFAFHDVILQDSHFPAIGIDGYWQSEQYFKDIAPIIRHDFAFRNNGKGDAMIESIRSTEAVCVHVRRQDYVSPIGAHLGFVGQEYYDRALEIMGRRVRNSSLFIFSDDIDWCKSHLQLPAGCTFVEAQPNQRSASCLNVMSQCKHFITANSTFSWWAAWLSSNPKKQVIAPRRWFARETLTGTTRAAEHLVPSMNLVPDDWIRV